MDKKLKKLCVGWTKAVSLSEKKAHVLFGYFLVISLLEVLAYKSPGIVSAATARLWFVTGLFLLGAFLCQAGQTIVFDVRKKNYVCLMGYAPLFLFLCFMVGNLGYADINADAAQQAAAGISSMEAADWNYTGTAFIGYPARQYLVAALPSLIFGRSVSAFHMGFAYPFLIGLTLVYLELRKWVEKEAFALIPVYAIVSFRFIAEYYLNYEQAITPVALAMICSALFLRMMRKPDILTAVALSWCGCLCVDSYTPALAFLGLLGGLIGVYMVNQLGY